MDPATLKQELRDEARRLGFVSCGVTSPRPFSEARERALAAIEAGRMEGMPWYTRGEGRGVGRHRRALPVGALDRGACLAVPAGATTGCDRSLRGDAGPWTLRRLCVHR